MWSHERERTGAGLGPPLQASASSLYDEVPTYLTADMCEEKGRRRGRRREGVEAMMKKMYIPLRIQIWTQH